MKKAIIALAIIVATGITALSVAKNLDAKPIAKAIKIDKTEFMNKGFTTQKNDLASAD